jgi:hypothetical protein
MKIGLFIAFVLLISSCGQEDFGAKCKDTDCLPYGVCVEDGMRKHCECERGYVSELNNAKDVVMCVDDPGALPGGDCSGNTECQKEDNCFGEVVSGVHLYYCVNDCETDNGCNALDDGTPTCCRALGTGYEPACYRCE